MNPQDYTNRPKTCRNQRRNLSSFSIVLQVTGKGQLMSNIMSLLSLVSRQALVNALPVVHILLILYQKKKIPVSKCSTCNLKDGRRL
ncbi:uncharacterized protein BdWA1_003541 [Babesia duncani]|uniref:Uncharacterized protein n=1 Tax=Babesia duncani TaxID=323732 RepID=A0AAD9UMP7_9APIC|nr:hypothetical protein BdWA1_003541 [Babesia duncani]